MKLTSDKLREIIAEEVAAVTQARKDSTRSVESLMTPEEEIALARAARRPTPATPKSSFEDFEKGYAARAADRRWADLSRKFPKLTKRLGRDAFDREWASREEGAAGGGGHLTYADEFRILLDLLEEEA
jgi:hypothetical protein